jgi:3-hydroxyacyl-[acyl-carrier-protein] dehydratase
MTMRTIREEIIARADGPVRVLEADAGYALTFRLGEDFPGFRGHFPGHPVLPAFIQLLMGQCALGLRLGGNWSLRKVARGKFLKTIQPNQPVTVCWREQPVDGGLRCVFTLLVNDEKAAVFTAELAQEGRHA